MGQKVHPIGFRLGVIREWDSRWFADKKQYAKLLKGDHVIRQFIRDKLGTGNISRVDIEREAHRVRVTLFTARPGAVIGRGGKGIDDLTQELDRLVSRVEGGDGRVHVNVSEVRQPELDAQLVAENIALQLERRISHRRAMRQAITRALRVNGRGMKIIVSGRLGGAEIARTESEKFGKIPLHTLRADIDYGMAEAKTTYGIIGIRVWVYKGEVLPERPGSEAVKERKVAATTAKPRDSKAQFAEEVREEAVETPAVERAVASDESETEVITDVDA